MADQKWWGAMGYPDFDTGPDGFPLPGQVVKHYRYLKKKDDGSPWTQGDLAFVLGTSEQTVRDLENRHRGFTMERRRFLSKLFHIPPALFGIVTLEEMTQHLAQQKGIFKDIAIVTSKKVKIDVEQSRDALQRYWESNHAQTAQGAMHEMLSWITLLMEELPYVSDEKQKLERYQLLIGYHRLIANILRDQQNYDQSITHVNIALDLAEAAKLHELEAILLHSRGLSLQEQSIIRPTNLSAALTDCLNAHVLVKSDLLNPLNGTILLEIGHILAKKAQSETDKTKALSIIDAGGNIVRAVTADQHFLKLDTVRYHLTRGSTLIALGRPRDAITELSHVPDNPTTLRRNAYRDILLAQAYANKGDYAYAAILAESALLIVKKINSQVNIERIAGIHQQIKKSPFKNNPEVGRLDWLLSSP